MSRMMSPSIQAAPRQQYPQCLSWVICAVALTVFVAALATKWQGPFGEETGDAAQALTKEQASSIFAFDPPAILHQASILHDAFGGGSVSKEWDLSISYGSALPGVPAHDFGIDIDSGSEMDVPDHSIAENIVASAATDRGKDHQERRDCGLQPRYEAGLPEASVCEPSRKLEGSADAAQAAQYDVAQLKLDSQSPPELAVPGVFAIEFMKTLDDPSFVSVPIARHKTEEVVEQELATSTASVAEMYSERFTLWCCIATMLAVLLVLFWFLAPARPPPPVGGVGVALPKKKEVDGSAAPDAGGVGVALPKKKEADDFAAPDAGSPPAKPSRQRARWAKEDLALALLCYVPGALSSPFAARRSLGMGKGRGSLALSRTRAQDGKGAPTEAGHSPEPKKTRRSRAATPEHKSPGTQVYKAPKMYLDTRNQEADRLKAYNFKSRRLSEVADREIARQVASAADAQEAQCQCP